MGIKGLGLLIIEHWKDKGIWAEGKILSSIPTHDNKRIWPELLGGIYDSVAGKIEDSVRQAIKDEKY